MFHRARFLVSVALVVSAASMVQAQSCVWSLGGGISQPMGPDAQHFELGFNAGTDFFLYVSPNLLIGGHIALNRWAPTTLFEQQPGIAPENAITIYEIIPSARISTAREFDLVNFFIQAGAGLYLKQQIPVSLDALTSKDFSDSLSFKRSIGVNVGAGIALGDMNFMTVEILPLYHYILKEEENLQYFSLGIGLSFRI